MKQLHQLTEYQFNTLRNTGLLQEIYPDSPLNYYEIKRFYVCRNCEKHNESNEELKNWVYILPLESTGFCSEQCFSEWWK